jgi:hypothetical protein
MLLPSSGNKIREEKENIGGRLTDRDAAENTIWEEGHGS